VPVPLWTSFEARPGQSLRLGGTRAGARSYLCVAGAILATAFLGSASTHTLSGLGGWEGRALRRGDVLPMGELYEPFRKRAVVSEALTRFAPRNVLRVTEGPQLNWFPEASRQLFFGTPYSVAEDSNRVGIRLEGLPVPARASSEEMITEGVSLGAIQVPPGGRPIIVFVEQQTTGGYPKIANVIAADLHKVGQLRPRDEIRFEHVEFVVARSLLKEQEEWLPSRSWLDE
jgi:antagonist of KipI